MIGGMCIIQKDVCEKGSCKQLPAPANLKKRICDGKKQYKDIYFAIICAFQL